MLSKCKSSPFLAASVKGTYIKQVWYQSLYARYHVSLLTYQNTYSLRLGIVINVLAQRFNSNIRKSQLGIQISRSRSRLFATGLSTRYPVKDFG